MSVGDTLELEPTHICERDRKELIRKFEEELEQRGPRIRAGVRKEYKPVDVELLPKNQRNTIKEWCDQALVLGFNCGRYDLNLNKEHFAERLADAGTKLRVAKQGKNIMFSLTPRFRFLDIINYVGPGTSYDVWTKAYGCNNEKSWLPYEWFDDPEKRNYPDLPDYPAWYSRLKG